APSTGGASVGALLTLVRDPQLGGELVERRLVLVVVGVVARPVVLRDLARHVVRTGGGRRRRGARHGVGIERRVAGPVDLGLSHALDGTHPASRAEGPEVTVGASPAPSHPSGATPS